MIRNASPNDLPELRALFARANDAPYDLAAVAEEKCFGHGIAGAPTVRVFGAMKGVVVTCGRWLRILIVDRDARRQGIGTALLRDAESRGTSVIAAEPGNYFTPGILDDPSPGATRHPLPASGARGDGVGGPERSEGPDEGQRGFFERRGYVETRATWNLQVELTSPRVVESSSVRRATHEEADRVLAFVEQTFGKIWRFEAAKAFDSDIPRAFITEQDDEITGFAVHEANNRGLGTFGPTGVIESARGRRLGCALLEASLNDLRRLGYTRAIIPWTEALEYYRKCCGAEPVHHFVTMAHDR